MLLRNDNSNYIASTVGKIADAGLRTVAHHTVYHFFFFFNASCQVRATIVLENAASCQLEH